MSQTIHNTKTRATLSVGALKVLSLMIPPAPAMAPGPGETLTPTSVIDAAEGLIGLYEPKEDDSDEASAKSPKGEQLTKGLPVGDASAAKTAGGAITKAPASAWAPAKLGDTKQNNTLEKTLQLDQLAKEHSMKILQMQYGSPFMHLHESSISLRLCLSLCGATLSWRRGLRATRRQPQILVFRSRAPPSSAPPCPLLFMHHKSRAAVSAPGVFMPPKSDLHLDRCANFRVQRELKQMRAMSHARELIKMHQMQQVRLSKALVVLVLVLV